MGAPMHAVGYSSHFITAQDGLKLHVRTYGRRPNDRLPIVCLPGLTRTSADFHVLASLLSAGPERRYVVALDYRGRGLSEHDRDPRNYSLPVELADVQSVLMALGIGRAVFVGTSRGGILTMLLATSRPTAIAGAVLNDIGPVIEPRGLMRIKDYVGKLPEPKSFEEGAEILRALFAAQFPRLAAEDWLGAARRTWEQKGDRLTPTYDVRLAKTLEAVDLERTLPPLWKEFDALARLPVMVLRGANSDLLSPGTVAAMQARRTSLEVIEIPDQGHPPLLVEPDVIQRIATFAASCEAPH
jgi:pimeloyl-ACP methyl ester carboxylesterase